jgi:hypothetical protein
MHRIDIVESQSVIGDSNWFAHAAALAVAGGVIGSRWLTSPRSGSRLGAVGATEAMRTLPADYQRS